MGLKNWTKEEKQKLLKELRDEFPRGGCECHPQVAVLMKELEEEK